MFLFFLLSILGLLRGLWCSPVACFKTWIHSGVQRKHAEGSHASSNLQPNRDCTTQIHACPNSPLHTPVWAGRAGGTALRTSLVGWKSPRSPYLACSDHSRRNSGTKSLAQSAEREFLFARSAAGSEDSWGNPTDPVSFSLGVERC